MMEHASSLLGLLVVAQEEGKQLGNICAVYIDRQLQRVVAIGYRQRRLISSQYYVPIESVRSIGLDVIFIATEKAARELSETVPEPGTRLNDLQGTSVTTRDGTHLGTLVDLEIAEDWSIRDLLLGGDLQLGVATD